MKMLKGITKSDALQRWICGSGVLCPGCERHVEACDAVEYSGVIWHESCANEDERINDLIDEYVFLYGS